MYYVIRVYLQKDLSIQKIINKNDFFFKALNRVFAAQ